MLKYYQNHSNDEHVSYARWVPLILNLLGLSWGRGRTRVFGTRHKGLMLFSSSPQSSDHIANIEAQTLFNIFEPLMSATKYDGGREDKRQRGR